MRNNNIGLINLTPLVLGLSLLGACSDPASETTTTTSLPPAVTTQQSSQEVRHLFAIHWMSQGLNPHRVKILTSFQAAC